MVWVGEKEEKKGGGKGGEGGKTDEEQSPQKFKLSRPSEARRSSNKKAGRLGWWRDLKGKCRKTKKRDRPEPLYR